MMGESLAVIEEGREFIGDIGTKRLREQTQFFTYAPDELNSKAAINRDHDAERSKCEENKRLREERNASMIKLPEERDHLSSKSDELEETLRGVLETVFFF